jgi:uncharacterized membrane protein YphA (DoxX/SURF4 family)
MTIINRVFQRFVQVHREFQALAFLRVVSGLFFLYLGLAKFNNPHMTDVLTLSVRTWAEHHPQPVYQAFLETVVLPNAVFFTRLVTFSELFIGLSYILGGWVRYSSLLGLLLNTNFLLATQHMGIDALGINLAFLAIHITLSWGQSGFYYGIDSLLSPVRGVGKKALTARHLKTSGKSKAKLRQGSAVHAPVAKSSKSGKVREKAQRDIRAALSHVKTAPAAEPKAKQAPPLKVEPETQSSISPKIRDLRD